MKKEEYFSRKVQDIPSHKLIAFTCAVRDYLIQKASKKIVKEAIKFAEEKIQKF